ncbi:MAG: fatty acid desaturase CarF family protein [Bdellovibrionales bacterium]
MKTLKCIQALQGPQKGAAYREYAQPRTSTWYEKSIVIADWAMATWIGVHAAIGLAHEPSQLVTTALLIPPTLFVADFIGQIFHKSFDSYTSEENPIWGDATRRFRQHHEVPSNLEKMDYLSNVTSFATILAPFYAGASMISLEPSYGAAVTLFLVTLMNATEFHRQAHLKESNWFFRTLQKLRLSVSHDQHMRHHRPPFDSEFTVINGWSEPVAKYTDLWRRMDQLWWKAFRKLPNNWIQDPRSIPEPVLKELADDINNLPPDLLAYLQAYPRRVTPEIQALVDKFIAER